MKKKKKLISNPLQYINLKIIKFVHKLYLLL